MKIKAISLFDRRTVVSPSSVSLFCNYYFQVNCIYRDVVWHQKGVQQELGRKVLKYRTANCDVSPADPQATQISKPWGKPRCRGTVSLTKPLCHELTPGRACSIRRRGRCWMRATLTSCSTESERVPMLCSILGPGGLCWVSARVCDFRGKGCLRSTFH